MIPTSTFGDLFDEHYPRLYAYIRAKVASQEIAEDLTAAAFERAFSYSDSYDSAKGRFTTWLFTIARNLIADHYAQASRRPDQVDLNAVAPLSAEELSPEQRVLRQEQYQWLLESLAVLSERDQEIIRLRFFGRLTNRKIAELLEMNEKTVSVVIYRALKKMKAELQAKETA